MGAPATSVASVAIFLAGCISHSFHSWWTEVPIAASSAAAPGCDNLLGERCLARLDALGGQVSSQLAWVATAVALALGAAAGSALTLRLAGARFGAGAPSAHASVSVSAVVAPAAAAVSVDETYGGLDLTTYVPKRR